jgi:chemotaxis signal transduction protein
VTEDTLGAPRPGTVKLDMSGLGNRHDDEVARTLAERARLLAAPPSDPDLATVPVLVVVAGDERIGIRLSDVGGVHRGTAMTAVPWVGDPWVALANVRGELVPVLDLGDAMGHPATAVNAMARVVLLERPEGPAAFGVSDVVGVIEVDPSTIGTSTPGLTDVIDVEALFADDALVIDDRL